MSYSHIDNLYRDKRILEFKRGYWLEKVDGTHADVTWRDGRVWYSGGCVKHANFSAIFDDAALRAAFESLGYPNVSVHGEAYGGKVAGRRAWYGDQLRFVAFDVRVDDCWLSVPDMDDVARRLGFDVVPWGPIDFEIPLLDAKRDEPSQLSARLGVGASIPKEGIVLRPPFEVRLNNDERVGAKHKGQECAERGNPPPTDVDLEKIKALEEATEIAREWVNEQRVDHVVDKMGGWDAVTVRDLSRFVEAIVEDVVRESAGEIVDSRAARAAIGRRGVEIFKTRLEREAASRDTSDRASN